MRRTERSRPAKAGVVSRSLASARSGGQLAGLKAPCGCWELRHACRGRRPSDVSPRCGARRGG
eukprot:10315841-Heterocapsa_arctica.AAC.1